MDFKICNIDEAPAGAEPVRGPVTCSRCHGGALRPERISTAFWQGEGLVVIRGIPAMVCVDCGEQFIDDRTARGLDRMHGEGFSELQARNHMVVPVFEFPGFLKPLGRSA